MATMLENLSSQIRSKLRETTEHYLGPDFAAHKDAISRIENEFGVDPFGFNLDYALAAVAPFLWMYKNYHRVKTYGISNIPAGKVLLVGNHSGQIPIDAAMIAVALLTEAQPPRAVRSMMEKWVQTLPYVSTFMARVGQIVGTPENCRRLLESNEAVLVFPEGVKGITKLYSERYQLQEFGLGFMRLALETKAPIVPVAVIGAEEQAPALTNLKPLAKLLNFPSFPITPLLLPFPLPTRYHIYFGAPMQFDGRADDDDHELEKKVAQVKDTISDMLQHGLRERHGVFT